MINIFEAELEKGSGIPYILIKKNIIGASPEVDSILLDNIFDCKAYDPGCEGLRAEYLYSIVKNYKNKEKIYKEVLNAFNSMTETDFGEQQIFSFVCIFADLVFRSRMYDIVYFITSSTFSVSAVHNKWCVSWLYHNVRNKIYYFF